MAALLLTIGLLLAVGAAAGGFAAYRFRRLARRADRARDDERFARIKADQLFAMARIAQSNEEASRKDADRKATEAEASRKDADRKAAEARATVDFFVNDMLGAARPENKRRGSPTVDDVLAAADRAIAGRFGDEPLLEAAIRHTMAETYWSLRQLANARRHAERAVALREEHLGPDDPEALRSAFLLARILHKDDQYAAARPIVARVLEARRRRLGEDDPETIEALALHAHTINNERSRRAEAQTAFERALDSQRRLFGADDPRTFDTLEGLAWTIHAQGRYDESQALWGELLERRRRALGPDHYEVARTLELRGLTRVQSGREDEGAADYEEAVRIDRMMPDPGFDQVYWVMQRLAHLWLARADERAGRGRMAEAQAAGAKALAACDPWVERAGAFFARETDRPRARTELVHALAHRAAALVKLGRLDDAAKDCDRIAEIDKGTGPGESDGPGILFDIASAGRATGRTELAIAAARRGLDMVTGKAGPVGATEPFTRLLADALDAAHRPAEAAPLHRELIASRRRKPLGNPLQLAGDLVLAGENAMARGELAEAEPLLRECLEIRARRSPEHWTRYNAESLLGGCLTGLKKYDEAESLLLSGFDGLKAREASLPPRARARVAEAGARVVALYEATGKAEQAAAWRAKLGLPAKEPEAKP